jgi:hypothetical protein
MAHEFVHLINYSLHFGPGKINREMDLWIDEGLAESAAYVYSGTLDKTRLDYFRWDPNTSINQGNNFFVWYDDWDDPLAEYATVYLFFQWLRIQAGTMDICSDIISSSHTDYQAVIEAVKKHIAEMKWEELLRTWFAANFLCSPSGLEGYGGKIRKQDLNVRPLLAKVSDQRILLAPGEGVYSPLVPQISPFYPPVEAPYGESIRYAGIDSNNETLNTDIPFNDSKENGFYLLTFNSNNKSAIFSPDDFEAGYVSDGSISDTLDSYAKVLLPGEKPPQPHEWDSARYFFKRINPVPPIPSRARP